MVVTVVGDQMCWWQVWDVGDRFRMLVTDLNNITKKVTNIMILLPTSQISHHHEVTNITMSLTSLSPIFSLEWFWIPISNDWFGKSAWWQTWAFKLFPWKSWVFWSRKCRYKIFAIRSWFLNCKMKNISLSLGARWRYMKSLLSVAMKLG